MAIHPGAALFPLEARQAVADGPLFDFFGPQSGDWGYMRRADHRCLVGALAFAAGMTEVNRTPGRRSARKLARTITGDWATPLADHLLDLLYANDTGRYAGPAGRANLYADLLGAPAPTPARGGGAATEGGE